MRRAVRICGRPLRRTESEPVRIPLLGKLPSDALCNTDPMTGSSAALVELVGLLDRREARIAIVGQGYVGLPLAMRAVELGFSVTGYDTAAGRVDALRAANSYVEDVSSEQLHSALESGYCATTDPAGLSGFHVAII